MPKRLERALAWTFPRWYARRVQARQERELAERWRRLRAWAPLPRMERERPDGGRGFGVREMTDSETGRVAPW